MTRPTINDLYQLVHGPPPPKNTTEPCGTCADYGPDEVEYAGGKMYGLCSISRERAVLYPILRSAGTPPTAVMPCWRARGEAGQ